MAVTALSTPYGMVWPSQAMLYTALWAGAGNSEVLTWNGTNDKAVFMGRPWWEDGSTTKNVHKIWFRAGTQTAASAGNISTFLISCQGVSTSSGPPLAPDGTVKGATNNAKVTVTFNGDTTPTGGITNSVWNAFTLGEDFAAAINALFAIEVTCTAYTTGALKFITSFYTIGGGVGTHPWQGAATLVGWDGAAYALAQHSPNVVLEADDGTLGTFWGSLPTLYGSGQSWGSNDGGASGGDFLTGNQRGIEWVQDFTVGVTGAWFAMTFNAGADFNVLLVEGDTIVGETAVDANQTMSTSTSRCYFISFSSMITLTAGLTYRLLFEPTTTNDISVLSFTSIADHACFYYGPNAKANSRVGDGGAFGAGAQTEYPVCGLIVAGLNSGGGGGGGGRGTNRGLV